MTDGYISTDIDKIISILKKKKRISLNDLAKESDISASLLEKWLPILEEEGLIDISYHLTRVYITWTGEEVVPAVPISRKEAVELPVEIHEALKPLPEKEKAKAEKEIKPKKAEKIKLHKMPSSLEKKVGIMEKEEEIKKIEKKAEEIPALKGITAPIEVPEKMPEEVRLPEEITPISIKERKKEKEIKVRPLKFDVGAPRKTKLDARAKKLKEYMEDINKARDELEKLKTEKRKLFREVYEPIEKKFSSELESISEKIAEKEEKILEIQQRALLLPGVIEEVDRQQLKLKEIKEEARKTFDDASITINESLEDLSELGKQAREQITAAREQVNSSVSQVEDMNELLTKIGSLEIDVKQKIEDARKRLEEEQKRINSLENSLDRLENIKDRTAEEVTNVVGTIETQKSRLADLQKEVAKIGEIQNWVATHKEEYGKLIDEFGAQIRENEAEYNKLRESIETDFVRRYVQDLSDISKGYEFEIGRAKEAEKNIDVKIEETKNKISELLKKSKEIVEAFEAGEKEAPIEIDIEAVGKKEKQLLQKIKTKEQERKEILEALKDIGKTKAEGKPKKPKEIKPKVKEKPKTVSPKPKPTKPLTYQEFMAQKRSEGLSMKQISKAWKKYKKEQGI